MKLEFIRIQHTALPQVCLDVPVPHKSEACIPGIVISTMSKQQIKKDYNVAKLK